jgi:hypothetical protein
LSCGVLGVGDLLLVTANPESYGLVNGMSLDDFKENGGSSIRLKAKDLYLLVVEAWDFA